MTIDIKGLSWGADRDGGYLMVRVGNPQIAVNAVENIEPDKEYTISIERKRRKRSLDANAYCWVLIGKLSAKVGISPQEIYRQIIPDIGENYEIMPIRNDAVDRFREAWSKHGCGWLTETLGDSKITGYTNIIAFYGSSVYDTRQMSRLIDLVVQECKLQGIETLTPRELEGLKENWNA